MNLIFILMDTETDQHTWFYKFHTRWSRTASFIMIAFTLTFTAILAVITALHKGIDTNTLNRFWINQGVKYLSIAFIQLLCGIISTNGVKVNYTRKVVHIAYFAIPQLLDTILIPFKKNIYTELWNICVIMLLLLFILQVVRERCKLFQIMFAAIDRPEDQPFTTFWFLSQLFVSVPIIAGFSILFSYWKISDFVFIPLIILAAGDGLAEPIGTRWGKHKYNVKSLFIGRTYTRSLEGSACVYISSIVALLIFYNMFTKASLTYSIMVIPYIMTLTEAFSPHTWDNPILLLVGYLLLIISYWLLHV